MCLDTFGDIHTADEQGGTWWTTAGVPHRRVQASSVLQLAQSHRREASLCSWQMSISGSHFFKTRNANVFLRFEMHILAGSSESYFRIAVTVLKTLFIPYFIASSQQPWSIATTNNQGAVVNSALQAGWQKLREQQNDSPKSHSYFGSQDLNPGRRCPETTPSSTTLQFIPWLFYLLFIINDSSFLEPKAASLIAPGSPFHPATLLLFVEVPSSLHSSLQNVVHSLLFIASSGLSPPQFSQDLEGDAVSSPPSLFTSSTRGRILTTKLWMCLPVS